jgi:hypothetical protein
MKRVTVDLGWCVALLERKRGVLVDTHEEFTVQSRTAIAAQSGEEQTWPTLLTIMQPEQEGSPASSVVLTTEGVIALFRMLQDHMPPDWYNRVWELEDARRDAETIHGEATKTGRWPSSEDITPAPPPKSKGDSESGVMCPGFVDPQHADLGHVPDPPELRMSHPSGVKDDFADDIPF